MQQTLRIARDNGADVIIHFLGDIYCVVFLRNVNVFGLHTLVYGHGPPPSLFAIPGNHE